MDPDLRAAEDAIVRRHLPDLGAIMERSALTMHASMWAAQPAIRYFKPVTLALMDEVERFRDGGAPAFYTMDAGPHVKAICTADAAVSVRAALESTDGVLDTLEARIGPGLEVDA